MYFKIQFRNTRVPLKMRLKKTRKERECTNCKLSISKGNLYGQMSKTIFYDPKGQSIGRIQENVISIDAPEWSKYSYKPFDKEYAEPFRLTRKKGQPLKRKRSKN